MKINTVLSHKKKGYPIIDPFVNSQDLIRRMVKENISEAPVIYLNRLLGLLDRSKLFESIINHRRVGDSILTVLRKNVITANPEDDIDRIINSLDDNQQVVPILVDGVYVNSIHREDLLKELIQEKNETINNYDFYIRGFGMA